MPGQASSWQQQGSPLTPCPQEVMGAWPGGTPSSAVDGEPWQRLMPGVQPPRRGWTRPSHSKPSDKGSRGDPPWIWALGGRGCPADGHGQGPLTAHPWRRAHGKAPLRYSHGTHVGRAAPMLASPALSRPLAPTAQGSPQVSPSVPGVPPAAPHRYLPGARHWEVSAGAAQPRTAAAG